ncbi:unannotated protein [freshwater metagenome]|uniref:Unannotated protein n=1 Tax=freshwater metagenome TaxID=449393 RepID=A0A6J7IYJ7_9ZZZZ
MHEPCVQPVRVRCLGCKLGFDLIVLDDPPGGSVDEEHSSRLQSALADNGRRIEVQDPGLGREHDESVVGHPESARAKAVPVEHRSDDVAVAEADVGGAVPRLHERRVELVERPACRIHRRVVLPRLRNHHEDGVRERPSAEMDELEHLVEGAGVAAPRRADREQSREVTREDVGGQHCLARLHPVAVPLNRVDLTVMRDEPVGVGKRPGGKGIRREAGVDERQRRRHELLRQVRVEGLELPRREHPLVDDGARRQ